VAGWYATRRGEEAWYAMKMALDVWYELWDKDGSEGRPEPNRHPDKEDGYYPWREDYLAWIRSKEARSDSH
jgi:hypothetical protein